MQNPSMMHWEVAMRVLRYLKRTHDFKLWFVPSKIALHAYSDADYAGCPDTRRSRTGYIVKVGHTAVAWRSKRQDSVATSSCESEYIAMCSCAKMIVWMRRLLNDMNVTIDGPTIMYTDNESANKITRNPIMHDRTKHIDVQYHYTRELFENNVIVPQHVSTVDEEADILTKIYDKCACKFYETA